MVDDDPQTLRFARSGCTALVRGEHAKLSHIVRTERPRLALPGTDGIELMRNVPELAELLAGWCRSPATDGTATVFAAQSRPDRCANKEA